MHQGAIVYGTTLCRGELPGGWIEIGKVIVEFPLGRRVFVPYAEIEREFRRDFPIILQIKEMHVLAQIGDQDVAERVLAAKPEQKVGEIVKIVCGGTGRTRKAARIRIAAVKRIHILHFGVDALKLVTGFQRVAAGDVRVVELRVEDGWILPLWIRRLAAQIGVAGDKLRGKAA